MIKNYKRYLWFLLFVQLLKCLNCFLYKVLFKWNALTRCADHTAAAWHWLWCVCCFLFRRCGYSKAKQDPEEEKMHFHNGHSKSGQPQLILQIPFSINSMFVMSLCTQIQVYRKLPLRLQQWVQTVVMSLLIFISMDVCYQCTCQWWVPAAIFWMASMLAEDT